MGIYLRKSVKVGPIRFNLSKSGVGVSAGVKGFRVGAGPKGNYVHMGRGGLYYRATISSPKNKKLNQNITHSNPVTPIVQDVPSNTHEPLKEIESADISKIVDSSSIELLNELNSKRKKIQLFPFAMVLSLVGLWFEYQNNVQDSILGISVVVVAGLLYAIKTWDQLSKTTVMFYEFYPDIESAYTKFHAAAEKLSKCSVAWHIEASGKVHDKKYHAGASNLIKRSKTKISKSEPSFVKTNIETVSIAVGKQIMHFFPDKVLIFESNGVGAVSYKDLNVSVNTTRFIEEDGVPSDAAVVDKTWKYVNKSGGPDKRFKDNKQIPICQYEELAFSSASGVNEVVQVSCCGYGQGFVQAMSFLGKSIPQEKKVAA